MHNATMSVTEAIEKIKRLKLADRLKALDELWDSVVLEEDSVGLPDWQKAIIQERLDDLDNNSESGDTWDNVKKRILGK